MLPAALFRRIRQLFYRNENQMTRLQSYSRRLLCLLPMLLGALLVGCGDGSGDNNPGGPTFGSAPTVTSTTPAATAKDVPIQREITARFSKAMNDKTINSTTFTLTGPGAVAVAGAVTLDAASNTATFKPASALAVNTLFTATVSTGAQDTGGVALASQHAWTFATETADTTRPTILSTNPANLANGVPSNRQITATFDEAIDPVSISAASFTLTGPGLNPVAGAVSSLGTTAIFTPPAGNLASNTTYTATIKAGVKDLAGNALLSDFVWRFTTADATLALAKGPAPVVLGTAGNFVILAKTGVSTTGTTAVTGDIGVSPAAETFLTGFAQARDASNVFSTSARVTGKLFAADMAPPTPSSMTTSVSNMETAYTDAAGRTEPAPTTELGAGNISGMTLAPGLYKWSSGLLLTSAVTLAGGANDVWIFQVAQDLTVGNAVIVTLSGGAQARNVFWQVAGQATLGTTSDVKGTILSKTLIALRTGAKLNGRALAQTAVTLDANAVTAP
jgi:hypothetical protein